MSSPAAVEAAGEPGGRVVAVEAGPGAAAVDAGGDTGPLEGRDWQAAASTNDARRLITGARVRVDRAPAPVRGTLGVIATA